MLATDSKGFVGFYEPTEVARIIASDFRDAPNISFQSRKVLRWIRAGLSSRALVPVPGNQLLLAFEDLVSMRVIAALRAFGVSFPKIYAAEIWLRGATDHPRPFATEQLWTESNDVFLDFQNHLVAASKSGQMAMEFVRKQLIPVHGLTFSEDHVAVLWEPRSGILFDPEIQLGQSCIKGTRIPTRAIWGMSSAGDSIEDIAEAYWLSVDEVKAAVAWENDLAA